MFSSDPFGKSKAPQIRVQTVKKLVRKPSPQPNATQNRAISTPAASPRSSSNTLAVKRSVSKLPTPSTPSPPAQSLRKVSSSLSKRKAPTPTRIFESSSEEEDEACDTERSADEARKRVKLHNGLQPDLERAIWIPYKRLEQAPKKTRIIHCSDLVVTDKSAGYKPAFDGAADIPEIELQYPSFFAPERFKLASPREKDGYFPLEDIVQTVEQVLTYYFPPAQSEDLLDETTGFPRRLKSAIKRDSLSDFCKTVDDYNKLLRQSLDDGTIEKALRNLHTVPLPLFERIFSQSFSRTVSLRVNELRQYENGTSNVYGELLPRFIHQLFDETNLTSSSVFLDLGSGIGNVALQAAIETGAESWGCEMMPNPCSIAQSLRSELLARARLWGIRPGSATLLQGDFCETKEIDAVLKRADVILVNNKAFTTELNARLMWKFLDVKEGARIISLVPFVDEDWKIAEHNQNDMKNLLRVKKYEYFSGCVSWTNEGGQYYIHTKDSSMLRRWKEKHAERRDSKATDRNGSRTS